MSFDKKYNNLDKNMQTLAWFGFATLSLTGKKMVAFGPNTLLANTNSILGQGGRYNTDSGTGLILTFATMISLSRLRMVKKKEEAYLGEM